MRTTHLAATIAAATALAELAPHYRDTLIAVDVVGLSYKEAAAALDVPIGTIMGRLHRARAKVAARREPAPALAAA